MDLCKKKFFSLLTWVNSFDTDRKIEDLSQLSDGVVLAQCLKLLGFRPEDSISQSPLEFVASKLNDFYSCDLTKCRVLQLSEIQAGAEEEIAKVLVLLLCVAVKHSDNEHFIETILSFPDDVQYDLKYYIEATLEQLDNGGLSSGDFILDFDRTCSVYATPMGSNLSNSKSHSFASPALQSWLRSPCTIDEATPKISNNQLFESLETKELKHKLKLIEKELEIQRSLVTDYEGEVELLSEERNALTVSGAEKDERIRQLQDKCQELEHLEDIEIKLQKAEEEIKNLKQQLEVAREEDNIRSELQQKITDQHEELKDLHQAKNLFQVKLLKYQHQVQELELECKSQQTQAARSLKRCNEALQRVDLLERQNGELQDELNKERKVLVTTSEQNASLQQQNCTANNELTLLQGQYATVMCTVGSQGQENERLQHVIHDMESKHTSELDAKDQQVRILEEQVALLTTRVEKVMVDNELQAKEFDEREMKMKADWEERISIQEAKNSSKLSKAEEMVKSCQLTISNLTRERDEERLSAAQQLHDLEAARTEKVKKLEQQISDCKESSEQQAAQYEQRLSEHTSELNETKECLLQKNKQLEQYCEMITLLEQTVTSKEFDCSEAERQHQEQLRQQLDELEKLKGEHEIKVLELSQQLEVVNSNHQMLVDANEELKEVIAKKDLEYNDLRNALKKQEQDYLLTLEEFEKLKEQKDALMLDLQQNQVVAEQHTDKMAKELEKLHDGKVKISVEFQTYRNKMQQKENNLSCDINKLRQENEAALQRDEQLTGQVKQYQEMITALEQKLSTSLASCAEAEEQHREELKQHSVELEKANDEHRLKAMELSRQLEIITKEYEEFKSKVTRQCTQEREEFSKKIANKEMEYAELQNLCNKQEKDHLNVLQQVEKLAEDKDRLLIDLKQSQLVAKQQMELVHHGQEAMSKELEQSHNEKLKMAGEHRAYQSVMEEKQTNLLGKVAELEKEKDTTVQKLEESVGKLALMEDEQNKLFTKIDDLNNTLECVRSDHKLEMESHQAAIDSGLSANNELEIKNKLLLQELSTIKEESLVLAEKLQSCANTEANSMSLWKRQVKQLEDDLCEVRKQLSSNKLTVEQLSNELFASKQEHHKILDVLEQKNKEMVQLEASHEIYKKSKAILLEERESKIALLQSQFAAEKQQSAMELQAVRNENEKLLKSVDELCSQQTAANTQLEQDCRRKFTMLEQSNTERLEEVAKMQVEMTTLLNELKELRLTHKDVIDCLNVEREKNNLLENEAKQLHATIKAFEKENARVNKLVVQQKYSIRPPQDEQAHLQQLHSEMDQLSSSHVIPSQPPEENENSDGRLEELRVRNSFRPPHLKSCYPVELQLHCGTPKSSELQLKSAVEKMSGYFEVSPPRKRNMVHRQQQQSDSPDCVRRRLSAPPTPTSQACKMELRSYLKCDQDENKAPPLSRPSDAFEISSSIDEQSRAKMEERKSKMFQRISATRKTHQFATTTTATKPLRTRNASKKK